MIPNGLRVRVGGPFQRTMDHMTYRDRGNARELTTRVPLLMST